MSLRTEYKKGVRRIGAHALCLGGGGVIFLFKSVFNGVVGHHFLFEDVSTGLGRLNHFDYLAIGTAFAFLERCDGFLCHILECVI